MKGDTVSARLSDRVLENPEPTREKSRCPQAAVRTGHRALLRVSEEQPPVVPLPRQQTREYRTLQMAQPPARAAIP